MGKYARWRLEFVAAIAFARRCPIVEQPPWVTCGRSNAVATPLGAAGEDLA